MIIDVKNVKPGMTLAQDVYLSEKENSLKYLVAGTVLTEDFINRLKQTQNNFEDVDIIPVTELDIALTEEQLEELGLVEDFVYPTIDQRTVLEAKRKLITFHNLNGASIKEIVQTAQVIASKILSSNSQFIYYLNDYIKDKDKISHSVRTSIFATVLAKAYNKEQGAMRINLEEIATAALLHNFGTICENDNVRQVMTYRMPPGANFTGLTVDKVKELEEHYDPQYSSYYSYCLLANKHELSETVKTSIAYSKETENERGPLKAKQLTSKVYSQSPSIISAKIINLCSTMDKYLMKFINEEDTLENVREVIGILEQENAFSNDLIDLLVANIPIYPIGTKVILQGEYSGIAQVVETYSEYGYWSRPKVKILGTGEIIDLRTEISTTISNVCKNQYDATNILDAMNEMDQSHNTRRAV